MVRTVVSAALAIVVGIAAGAAAQQVDPEIQKLITQYEDAWGKGDAKAIAALHVADAIRVGNDAQPVVGRDAIEKVFAKNFAGPWKGTKVRIQTARAQTVATDVRVVEGSYEVTGAGPAPLRGRFLNTMVRQQGQWRLASVAAIPEPAAK